ncbi:MAG: hypothetical protein ACJ72P_09210, partial [Nocardioides sp.]
MSTTTSYPRVLRLLALLTAVVLVSWGTAALSPADAAEHGNTHKTTKSNSGNGAAQGQSSSMSPGQAKTNGADKAHGGGSQQGGGSTDAAAQPAGGGESSSAAPGNSGTHGHTPAASPSASASQGAGQGTQGGDQSAQPAAASSAPVTASQSTTSSKGAQGDPKGNNGTIKLAGFDAPNGPGHSSGEGSTPMHPSNDPHLPCTFAVEGYGFDSVASHSVTTFDQHAPTGGGSSQTGSIPLDGDSHSGGGSTAGYDGVQGYTLTFVGDPHPVHGYHVKLTATTDYSQGSNVKHKVFWVEPCETTTSPGDSCPDMPGHQAPGTDCTPPEEDACPDMEGHQPPGTQCTPPKEDACPDMD